MKKFFALLFIMIVAVFAIGAGGDADNGNSVIIGTGGPGGISWTAEERAFMEQHPVIQLGVDPRFVPFEFFDANDEYKGIAADYLQLIAAKTGLQFEVHKGLTWPEAYDMALAGKLDALPAIGKTAEREQHFLFSKPYYYFKRVLVTRDTDVNISDMKDLAGLTVAVQRNSSHHSYLLGYPTINLSLYGSVEAALAAVTTGTEKAFIGNLATSNYLIRTNGLTNLRFVAFEAEKDQALYFAARQDWPQLVEIFDKAVGTISSHDKIAINNKWIELETHLDYGPIIRVIVTVVAFFVVALAVSLFWITRLRKEILQRKQVQLKLEQANCETDAANVKLLQANEELRKITMVDGLTGISNRRYFDSFLQNVWGINMREKFPLALIMIDIDYFKQYNDTHGHLAGDECLKGVANLIKNTVRRPGDFVARYGGEEFGVILSNTSEDGAVALAEKIRLKIESHVMKCGDLETSVTVSLGVASIVTCVGAMTPVDLIEAADSALYQAKKDGRNRVVRASQL